MHGFVTGKFEWHGNAWNLGQLGLIQFLIAAQHQRHEIIAALTFLIGSVYHQGLECLPGRYRKQFAQGIDAVSVTRVDEFGRKWLGLTVGVRQFAYRELTISGIVATTGENDFVFPGLGENVELVGGAATYIACVSEYGAKIESQAREDCTVGSKHLLVGFFQAGIADVERIGIFHDEFPCPHDTKPGAALVTKFGLNLVEVGRKLLVAGIFAAHQIGNHLFMGRAEAKVTFVAVLNAQQLRTHGVPAPGFMPQLGGLDHGHGDFHGAGLVHFVANNVGDFVQDPQSHREPGIQAAGQFTDQAGPQHQLMADCLGIGRGFFDCGQQVFTGAHRNIPSKKRKAARGCLSVTTLLLEFAC